MKSALLVWAGVQQVGVPDDAGPFYVLPGAITVQDRRYGRLLASGEGPDQDRRRERTLTRRVQVHRFEGDLPFNDLELTEAGAERTRRLALLWDEFPDERDDLSRARWDIDPVGSTCKPKA